MAIPIACISYEVARFSLFYPITDILDPYSIDGKLRKIFLAVNINIKCRIKPCKPLKLNLI